mmetsp:Transcript_49188/g.91129  ORF Transcript_49188/g.91129 Transcript_49188/m.91129 type:complete len:90 (-) Transcript_49188:220-489(-)
MAVRPHAYDGNWTSLCFDASGFFETWHALSTSYGKGARFLPWRGIRWTALLGENAETTDSLKPMHATTIAQLHGEANRKELLDTVIVAR